LTLLLAAGLCLGAGTAVAQSVTLNLPRQSQHAVLMQRVGITDITLNYHRPLVAKRKIFGSLVPYGQVWRAGANENTTIKFTDPVSIEGKPLEAGTYGLHMIPNENSWTVIFSKAYQSWGSFTYDPKEDALRVDVKPQAAEFREALTYDFDEVTPDATLLTMRWEKVAVPVHIGVNTNQIVETSLHSQLRGLTQYTWDGWDDAANFLLAQKVNLPEALQFCDRSIQNEERYENLMTKAQVLTALDRKDEAATFRAKALERANVIQTHTYARQLQQEGKDKEAFEIFRQNAQKHPESWVVHVGLSRMYSAQGDFPNATKEITTALASAPDNQKLPLQGLQKRLEAKEDINK
jgi:tetratricopeptide (TPR) repeat protein